MDKMIIEGVRCFRSEQEVPLAPLTLLVGENSTGKSTFLAAIRTVYDLVHAEKEPNFNEEPFNLGAYSDIANYAGGRGGRAKCFRLGVEVANANSANGHLKKGVADLEARPRADASPGAKQNIKTPIRLLATFCQEASHPRIADMRLASPPYTIAGNYDAESSKVNYVLTAENRSATIKVNRNWGPSAPDIRFLAFLLRREVVRVESSGGLTKQDFDGLQDVLTRLFRTMRRRPYAMAPVRTKPERTYDPKTDTPRPEGRHIPMVLARMVSAEPENWATLRTALSRFGKACGLFDTVTVRRPLGKKESDPFQIQIRVAGPAFNLVDVGYGVSQVLPILVDSLLGDRGQMFLMQQPEVHLHPRAQAELGTFLAQLVKQDRKSFIVETHSDYLIDRVRLDVRDGVGLRPDDVVILYFQRGASGVKIHPIRLDAHGNLENPPRGYRQFFLQEERRFFGV